MDDADVGIAALPGWIPDSLRDPSRLIEFTESTKNAAFHCETLSGDVALERIPSGWTVSLDKAGSSGDMTIEAVSAPRVTLRLTACGSGRLRVGEKFRRVVVAPATAKPAKLTLRSKTTLVATSSGTYDVSAVEGEGYTFHALELEEPQQREFVIQGSTAPTAFIGDAGVSVRIDAPATNVRVEAAKTLHFTKPVEGLTCAEVGAVTCDGSLSGVVRIAATAVNAGEVSARGSITCETFRTKGSLAPGSESGEVVDEGRVSPGGLEVCAKKILVTGSARACTLKIIGPDGEVVVGPRDARPQHFARYRANSIEAAEWNIPDTRNQVALERALITGDGSVSVWGSLVDAEVVVSGSISVLGSISYSTIVNVAKRLPDDVLDRASTVEAALRGGDIAVRGQVDLGNRTALFDRSFYTKGAKNAVLSGSGVAVLEAIQAAELHANRVVVGESVAATIDATESLAVTSAREGVMLKCKGDIEVRGDAECAIDWRPSAREDGVATFVATGALSHVDVYAPEGLESAGVPMLRLSALPKKLQVKGVVGIESNAIVNRGPGRAAIGVSDEATLVLYDTAQLRLGNAVEALGSVVVRGRAEIVDEVKEKRTVRLRLGEVDKDATLVFRSASGELLVARAASHTARLEIDCELLKVQEGSVTVTTVARGTTGPWLVVAKGAGIDDLSGPFVFTNGHEGRITGHVSRWGFWDHLKGRAPSDRAVAKGARLVPGAKEPTNESTRSGKMVDVDVTELDPEGLRALTHLHVFEPLDSGLIAAAKTREEGDRQGRAQRFSELANLTRSRAVSGSSYSAALWAAAHSHAVFLSWRRWPERFFRCLHRLVGYGARPGPAAMTYVVVLFGISALLRCGESEVSPNSDEFRPGPYSFWDEVARVLVLPTSLFRGSSGGALPYEPIGHSIVWQSLATLLMTLLLGFLALALKNYLLRPKGDPSRGFE